MSRTPGKKLLINKFSSVEDSLMSSELGLPMPTEILKEDSLKNEQGAITEDSRVGFAIILKKGVVCSAKMATEGTKAFSDFAMRFIFIPISKRMISTASSFKKKKIKAEVEINKYLNVVESSLKEKKEISALRISEEFKFAEGFQEQLQTLFKISDIEFDFSKMGKSNQLKIALLRDLSFFELLMNRLEERKLNNNIFQIKHSSSHDGKRINHRIEFGLKVDGIKWALFNSKFVLPDLGKKLSAAGGTLNAEYLSNVTLGFDRYILSISTPLEMVASVTGERSELKSAIRSSLSNLEN